MGVTRGREERGTAGKPLDAGSEAWREERAGSGETAERRERGMEGGKQAAGKPLSAGSKAWREERRQQETAGHWERGMEGGEEAAGNRWTQGARHGGRRGGSRKPLDAGREAWREESRQRVNR